MARKPIEALFEGLAAAPEEPQTPAARRRASGYLADPDNKLAQIARGM